MDETVTESYTRTTPFELLFGHKPRISLDTRRTQNFRKVRLALDKRHQNKVKTRLKANNRITRESGGTVVVQIGDLVLVK